MGAEEPVALSAEFRNEATREAIKSANLVNIERGLDNLSLCTPRTDAALSALRLVIVDDTAWRHA